MRLTVLAALALLAVAGCGDGSPLDAGQPRGRPAELTTLPRTLTTAERQAVTSGTEFSLALFREVSRRKPDSNVFVSPLSAAVALAMTAQGAAGETDAAMRRTLGFSAQTLEQMGEGYRGLLSLLLTLDPSVTLRSANAIWYRNGLPVERAFVDATQRLFAADVRAADFTDQARTLGEINGWAKEKTNGKIEKVLDRIEDRHVMFLLNALYFKGAWRDQFDPAQTRREPFTSSQGRVATASLMHRTGGMRYARGDGFQAVDLPYGNAAFSMTVLLPDAGRSADALAASLDAERWDALVASLRAAEVDLALPRFKLEYADQWNDVLTTLGMGVAFDRRAADFSRMARVEPERLFIDFVKQNTYVDVNEEGTEAAAVTTVGMGVTSLPLRHTVRVDRPFVFAIREHLTGTVLFIGKMNALP